MTVLLPVPTTRPVSAPALLLVAHGSADPAAARTHQRLVGLVREVAPALEVAVAYLDHAAPSLSGALRGYAAAGRPVVAVPLLLSAAAHAKGDIPGALRAARDRHPALAVGYADVLGPHPLVLAALMRRLGEVPAGAALVLAAAGSADPDANAGVARAARLLWEWRGGPPVEYAFASATGPTVAEAITRLRLLGYADIAVASYFLAPGRLPGAVRAAAAGLAVTDPIGDTPEIARLVLERYAAAAGPAALGAGGGAGPAGAGGATGPAALGAGAGGPLPPAGSQGGVAVGMPNGLGCDACQYRAAWPGREHRVGAPQRAHSHPLDD